MSSLKTSAAIIDILRLEYKETLLQIKRGLTKDHFKELRFYFDDLIPEELSLIHI